LAPAEQYSSCPVPVMQLSYNWSALNAKIDAMSPDGNTNQAIGLQWAWQTLTSSPFTVPAKDPNYQYNDVIILLSDGLNTEDRWYTTQPSIDARQQITCNNIKAAGITIYTVQVNTNGDPTSALMQNCASSTDKFFLLTSSSAILITFNQIGTALSNLRVAK
jgi:von Willebrand factor type A domain